MTGQPRSRAASRARLDAMREISAWRHEKAAAIDALTDISDDDRAALHEALRRTWTEKTLAATKIGKKRGRRTLAQIRAELDGERT